MVRTRNATRLERDQQDGVLQDTLESDQPGVSVPPAPCVDAQDKMRTPRPTSSKSVKSRRSSTSSTEVRRKRLELELQAAQEKAKIRLELVEKQLELNIAELDEEDNKSYSSLEGEVPTTYVHKWLEEVKEMVPARSANERVPLPSELPTAPAHLRATVADEPPLSREPCSVPACTPWHTPIGEPNPPSPLVHLTGPPAQVRSDPQTSHTALLAPHGQPPAPMENNTSEATIQMLASALKAVTTNSVGNGVNANLLSRICTPRDLPEFTGEPLEWLQFKQAYDESTEVCNFTEKENLWRLRKCLRGAAKDAVSALLISASSPDRIIATLELRFGNPDYIISRILQDVKRLQPMTNEYQKDIVIFACKIQNFVEAVRAVRREEYLYGMNIVSVILSKLPSVLLAKWTDYSYAMITQSKKSRLIILSDFLNEEAVKVSTTANMYYNTGRSDSKQRIISHYPYSQTVLVQAEESTSAKCNFCSASVHKLTECKQFKRVLRKVRWQYVKRQGICYKCLLSRHDRETCPAPVCDKDGCGQAHHKLLHYLNSRDREVTVRQSNVETITHINNDKCKVLLKVVPIRIHGPNGVISASALLDDGSTVSLISDELAARAGLRGRRETMRVRGAWTDNDLVCDTAVMNVDVSGPDLLSSLYGIMLRFRINSIAVTGDIKDMFLRVKIHSEDQHALRFLWRDNPNEPVKTYVMTSLIFGANCSPFVTQFIKNKNATLYESSLPAGTAAVDAIIKSHYMDDYIQSLPNEATAIEMVKNVSYIHKQGGFNIRNWTSNSLAVLESVPKDTLGPAAIRFKIAEQNDGERTLGLIWYPGTDELGFDVSIKRIPQNILQGKERPTKRLMLRIIMSIFDIFGFLSPFTIQGRIILQDTWRLNIGWDEFIPDNIYSKWCYWVDLLKAVNKIRVARCYHNVVPTPGRSTAASTQPAMTRCYENATTSPANTFIGQLPNLPWNYGRSTLPENKNIAIHVTPPDGDEDDEVVPPLRVRRKLSTPLSSLPNTESLGLLAASNMACSSPSRSLSPLDRTKRRFSTMVSSATAAAVSRRLSATIGWCLATPTQVKPQIVRQGRALCLQYVKSQIRRSSVCTKKQIVMKRLQRMIETECGEEATSNIETGVLAALRALCAALERKRPDAFRHVARQATRAPTAMLRSETALGELALALARRITRENITWSKIAAVFCICGALAKEAAEAADGEPSLELISAPAAAIADLLHEEPGSWIVNHGGWNGLIERLRASETDQRSERTLRVVVSFFVIACFTLLVLRWVLHSHPGYRNNL